MNTLYFDLMAAAASLLCCFVYNHFLYKHPDYASKKGFTYFLALMAMYPLLNMMAHLIAVGTYAIIRLQAGAFEYDMKFYALIQFGVLLVLINMYLLNRIKHISRGNWSVYPQIVMACVLQSLIVLPLFPFNPISLLPVLTSIILVLRLTFARRGQQRKSRSHETESRKGCYLRLKGTYSPLPVIEFWLTSGNLRNEVCLNLYPYTNGKTE